MSGILPERERVAKMLRADLQAARAAWLKSFADDAEQQEMAKTSFLMYRDDAGRVADFHALWHTFITSLAAGGVHPKTAQALARHSSITLTMGRYAHARAADHADALSVLPVLPDPASEKQVIHVRATGTDGKAYSGKLAQSLSPSLSLTSGVLKTSMEFGRVSEQQADVRNALIDTAFSAVLPQSRLRDSDPEPPVYKHCTAMAGRGFTGHSARSQAS